jgi:hypothetical protein
MFDSRKRPNQRKTIAASAALVTMAAILAAPAVAATTPGISCPETNEANLHVQVEALTAVPVNHEIMLIPTSTRTPLEEINVATSATVLAPLAEAAIRDAFQGVDSAKLESPAITAAKTKLTAPMAGTDSKVEASTEKRPEVAPVSGMNTKLPGISDDEFSRYKKQMYRRDI